MKAIVLHRSCRPDELKVSEMPVPEVKPGWVLIRIRAIGLNHSELIMRAYEVDASYISKPRIPGIECAGEIADASDSHFSRGQRIVALMGGMGRSFDGSYAEYALVPARNVFKVETNIEWAELAAIPETYFTAWGSLFDSLQLRPDDTLFVRGGTSALGLAAIQLGKSIGATVAASTRDAERSELLKGQGADIVVIDDATLREQMLSHFPSGFTRVLELIGPATLLESAALLRHHGIICSTGVLGGKGALNNFDPIKNLPSGVYLTGFFSNNPSQVIVDRVFNHIKEKKLHPRISKVYSLEETGIAHALMESNMANGKVVIRM